MGKTLAGVAGGNYQWGMVALLFFFFACNSPAKKSDVEGKSRSAKTESSAKPANNTRTDTYTLPVSLYVTKKDGVSGWLRADSSSTDFAANDSFAYGTRLTLINKTKGWIEVRNDECQNCPNLFIPATRKCLSPAANLNLQTADLNAVYTDPKQANTDSLADTNSKLTEFSLERISKEEFYRQKIHCVNNFKADTGLFPRKKGVLTLNTAHKAVKLKDVQDGEHEESYYYLGHYAAIHQFVVAGSYNESSDVFFVNVISGKIIDNSFSSFPYLSANKKYAVCLSIDDADNRGDIGLYAVKKDTVMYMAGNHFQYWMPALNSNDFFWGNDNSFYFLLVPYGAYPETDNYERVIRAPNPVYKYARIKFTRSLK